MIVQKFRKVTPIIKIRPDRAGRVRVSPRTPLTASESTASSCGESANSAYSDSGCKDRNASASRVAVYSPSARRDSAAAVAGRLSAAAGDHSVRHHRSRHDGWASRACLTTATRETPDASRAYLHDRGHPEDHPSAGPGTASARCARSTPGGLR